MFKKIRKLIAIAIVVAFFTTSVRGPAYAQDFSINQLPVPGTMVGESVPFAPLALKGLIVNPQKPLEFQFIVDTGSDVSLRGAQATKQSQQDQLKQQANQLVKYFLAGLTIPEGDLWVNLSPYEKDRMVPTALGQTDLGRDLLAQDYILKQLTASLIYPEKDLGKEFWSKVYAKAQKQFGTTNVPVNTFNKVWILPDQAQVYENKNAAYVTRSTLKVMLDEDYTAFQKHVSLRGGKADEAISERTTNNTHTIASQIVREIILPEIEKEVNTGKNFAPLRQIYQALILAKWYKETIQNGLLDAIYTNKNKVAGVNLNDPAVKEQIYQRYIQAYKKGAFNYIKESPMPDGQVVPRKYFSGGFKWKVVLQHTKNFVTLSKSLSAIAGTLLLFTFGCASTHIQSPTNGQVSTLPAYNLPRINQYLPNEGPKFTPVLTPNQFRAINPQVNLPRINRPNHAMLQTPKHNAAMITLRAPGVMKARGMPLMALKDNKVLNVFRQIVARRYDVRMLSEVYHLGDVPKSLTYKGHQYSVEGYTDLIIKFLTDHIDKDPFEVSNKFHEEFPHMARPPELDAIFDAYMKIKMDKFDLEVLKDAVPPRSSVADIGAGKNRLGAAILEFSDQNNLRIQRVIGTDLNPWPDLSKNTDPRLAFVVQESGTYLPLPSNSLNAVIVKWVLHHMPHEDQINFLRSAWRVLKPGGRLIIFDSLGAGQDQTDIMADFNREMNNPQTWPKGTFYNDNKKLSEDFLALTPQQQLQVHALEDYFGHNLVMGRDAFMPQHFTYPSVKELKYIMSDLGFDENVKLRRVYGSAPIIRMGPPSLRIVFEKSKQAPFLIGGGGGENKDMFLIKGLNESEQRSLRQVLDVLVKQDRKMVRMLVAKEKVQDLVLIGNDRLDTFSESLDVVNAGLAERIVVLGEFGRATLSMIDRAVSLGYDVKISPTVTVNSKNWYLYRERITPKNQRDFIRNSEAEIIKDLLVQMIQKFPPIFDNLDKKLKKEGARFIVTVGDPYSKDKRLLDNTSPNFFGHSAVSTNQVLLNYRRLLDREGVFKNVAPFKIMLLNTPLRQLRSQSYLESVLSAERAKQKVEIVGHTVSYDNVSYTKASAIKEIVGEVWRLVIYSDYGKGDLNLRSETLPQGIDSLSPVFWGSVTQLINSLGREERKDLAKELVELARDFNGVSLDKIIYFAEQNKGISEFVSTILKLSQNSAMLQAPKQNTAMLTAEAKSKITNEHVLRMKKSFQGLPVPSETIEKVMRALEDKTIMSSEDFDLFYKDTVHGFEHSVEITKKVFEWVDKYNLTIEDSEALAVAAFLHDINGLASPGNKKRAAHHIEGGITAEKIISGFGDQGWTKTRIELVKSIISTHRRVPEKYVVDDYPNGYISKDALDMPRPVTIEGKLLRDVDTYIELTDFRRLMNTTMAFREANAGVSTKFYDPIEFANNEGGALKRANVILNYQDRNTAKKTDVLEYLLGKLLENSDPDFFDLEQIKELVRQETKVFFKNFLNLTIEELKKQSEDPSKVLPVIEKVVRAIGIEGEARIKGNKLKWNKLNKIHQEALTEAIKEAGNEAMLNENEGIDSEPSRQGTYDGEVVGNYQWKEGHESVADHNDWNSFSPQNILREWVPGFWHRNSAMLHKPIHQNKAALVQPPGGIDLNKINVLHNGKTVNVQFDPALLKKLVQGGFEGFTPVIINITPISSPFELLGVAPAKQEVLVKA